MLKLNIIFILTALVIATLILIITPLVLVCRDIECDVVTLMCNTLAFALIDVYYTTYPTKSLLLQIYMDVVCTLFVFTIIISLIKFD